MGNQEDWKEIEKYIKEKDNQKIAEYGFDINKELENQIKRNNAPKTKRIKKAIKINFYVAIALIVIPLVVLLGMTLYFYYDSMQGRFFADAQETIEGHIGEKIKIKTKDVDDNENGVYTFIVKDKKEIEIHAIKKWGTVQHDAESQYFKYYFERWEDSEKEKFIVDEGYVDTSSYEDKTTNWLLDYNTYIEVNNYQEMIDATEAIIRFLQYMNKNINVDTYIRFNGIGILPNSFSPATYNQMRENAKLQYIQILKKNNLKHNDVPKDVYNKYSGEYEDAIFNIMSTK